MYLKIDPDPDPWLLFAAKLQVVGLRPREERGTELDEVVELQLPIQN
jgi:hypothetical protein